MEMHPKKEDSIVKKSSNFREAVPQFLAVSVKNLLLLAYGMTLGFPTIVIPAIQGGEGRERSDLTLNNEQISWFSSINLICVPLGCIFSGMLTQPFGKKKAMQVVNIPILISWLLFHFSTNAYYLYGGLFLSGLSGGLMEAAVLTYVAEITQPKYRGILAASGSTCIILGIFLQFILGSVMDWRTVAAVNTAFPVLCIVCLCFIPESPHWLIKSNKLEEAIKSLAWLRGWVPHQYIEEEFEYLYDLIIVKGEPTNSNSNVCQNFKSYKRKNFLIPFFIIAFAFFIGHFSGKTTLQTYAVQIFHSLKAPINKYHATILLGIAELIGTILCVVLIHFTGKRPLVLVSTVCTSFCFFGTAVYAYYLNIVPGFAIDNVVVNASSSSIHQNNVISRKNISEIFKIEKMIIENATSMMNISTSNINETQLILLPMLDNSLNLTKRNINSDETNTGLNLEYLNETFPLEKLNFDDDNHTNYISASVLNNPTATKPKATTQHIKITDNIVLPVPKQQINKFLWLPLTLLLGAAFFTHIGIRMIPWMLISEVYPIAIRSNAAGISSGFGYMFGFLANKFFLQMVVTMTLPGIFWFNSIVSILGAIVLYFILPETEGYTLLSIEEHFSNLKFNILKMKSITTNAMTNTSSPSSNINENNGNNIVEADQSETQINEIVEYNIETIEYNNDIPVEIQNSKAIGLKKNRLYNPRVRRTGCDNKAYITDEQHKQTTQL